MESRSQAVSHTESLASPASSVGLGGVSARQFGEALAEVATPVLVVTTDGPFGRSGLTCSFFSRVSDTPPILGICIQTNSAAVSAIMQNGMLCVNCLSQDQQHLANVFAGVGRVPMSERFDHGSWGTLVTGCPVADNAVAAFDCKIIDTVEIGTHVMVLAKVLATVHTGLADPLLYQRRTYATVRKL